MSEMSEMDTNAQGSKEQVNHLNKIKSADTEKEKQKTRTAVADENEDWVKKCKEQNHGEEPSFF